MHSRRFGEKKGTLFQGDVSADTIIKLQGIGAAARC
jgi:hypothetical protein